MSIQIHDILTYLWVRSLYSAKTKETSYCSSLILAEDNTLHFVHRSYSRQNATVAFLLIRCRIFLQIAVGSLGKCAWDFLTHSWVLIPSHRRNKKRTTLTGSSFFCFGGGHGTRTHGAVTPYLISNQAP